MHIKQIISEGIKNGDTAQNLAPCTLIHGPNFSGKTRIVDAVRLALLGYIPELGKRNSDTIQLASTGSIRVEALFSDGDTVERKFWTEKGTVKSATKPDDAEFENPLLDSAEYSSLSESQRINYVFEKVAGASEFTADSIIAKLHRISFGTEHSEAIEKAKEDVIRICSKTFREAPSVRAALTVLTESTLREEYTIENRRAKESEGAVRTLTALKLREPEAAPETVAELKSELSEVRGKLADMKGALEVEREQQRTLDVVEQSLAITESDMNRDKERMDHFADRVRKLNAEAVPCPEPVEAPSVARANELDKEKQSAKRDESEAAVAMAKVEAKLEELQTRECCPFCQSKKKGWKDELEKVYAGQLTGLRAQVMTAQKALDVIAVKERDATTEYEKEVERYKGFLSQSKKHSDWMKTLEADKLSLEVFSTSYQRKRAALDAHEKKLAELLSESDPEKPNLSHNGDEARELAARESELEQKLEGALRLRNDLVRAAQAAEAHENAKAKAEVIKAVGKELKELKGCMVADAFNSILVTANAIAGSMLHTPLAYNPDKNEIGRWGALGQWISNAVFSGTEKALADVAVAAALSAQSEFLVLILDELARLTPTLQTEVLELFAKAVKHQMLDQVLVVLPSEGELQCKPGSEWAIVATA